MRTASSVLAVGKVRVTKTEKPTQRGGWTRALVGIIFPPAVLGAAVKALV